MVNTTPLPEELLKKYKEQDEYPVVFNYESDDVRVVPADLLANESVQTAQGDVLKRSLIRHDSRKLARKLVELL